MATAVIAGFSWAMLGGAAFYLVSAFASRALVRAAAPPESTALFGAESSR